MNSMKTKSSQSINIINSNKHYNKTKHNRLTPTGPFILIILRMVGRRDLNSSPLIPPASPERNHVTYFNESM